MDSHINHRPNGATTAPIGWARSGRGGQKRLVCVLTTLHPERSLSRALLQHLANEMPDMDFALQADAPDVIWVCGFEPGAEVMVAALRERNPQSFLVVTGRGPLDNWRDGVYRSGADYVCGWPLPVEELSRILRPDNRP